jgi:hypothetical protein
MDDSGTRNPDHSVKPASHGHDWFAMGGILIDDENIPSAEQLIDEFRLRWPQMGVSPLHSTEIRGSNENFSWLGTSTATKSSFLNDLEQLLFSLPVIGLACTIDRPGYNARYREKYNRQRWALCKTAFSLAVERAAKHALQRERKLRVYVEKCSKKDDQVINGYYDALKEKGQCFNPETSSKYSPLTTKDFSSTLYEFRTKNKSSRLTQIADLYLWPICMGGYLASNRAYAGLRNAGKLIDTQLKLEEINIKGIKYSCFDQAT